MVLTLDINNPKQQCNLACEFCYSWNLAGILSLEDVKRIVSQHSSHSLIEIGGGEPMLHNELADIVEYLAVEAQKNIHVSTNGTVVSHDFMELSVLAKKRTVVQVSLHASNPVLFGCVTGKPELFYCVLENLKIFNANFPTCVNTVVYKRNYSDVSNIVDLVKSFDVPHRITLVMPVGKGNSVQLLSREEIADLTSFLIAERARGTRIDSPLLHSNTCPVLAKTYCMPKTGRCPMEAGYKHYVNAEGMRGCEFYAQSN